MGIRVQLNTEQYLSEDCATLPAPQPWPHPGPPPYSVPSLTSLCWASGHTQSLRVQPAVPSELVPPKPSSCCHCTSSPTAVCCPHCHCSSVTHHRGQASVSSLRRPDMGSTASVADGHQHQVLNHRGHGDFQLKMTPQPQGSVSLKHAAPWTLPLLQRPLGPKSTVPFLPLRFGAI